jgi:hypothetical protein
MPEGRSSVPEGRSDRSQARSAWNSPTPKNRPVGHGMIGGRPNPRGFRVERFAVFFKEIITPIMESVRIPTRIRPYPTGRLV